MEAQIINRQKQTLVGNGESLKSVINSVNKWKSKLNKSNSRSESAEPPTQLPVIHKSFSITTNQSPVRTYVEFPKTRNDHER